MVKIWLSGGLLWLNLVLFASLSPVPTALQHSFDLYDKLIHLVVYAGLMWWFCQIYARSVHRWVFLLLACFGLLVEFFQGMGTYRVFDPADVLANCVGILIAWFVVGYRFARIIKPIENRAYGDLS
ncbi:MAG: VanZ family protein [Gammaproteobacteria bacterium]|nr:VanZ family protein [Gammaproteobacteria bacterium]